MSEPLAQRIIDRKKSITINGSRYPLPRKLKEKIFYEQTDSPRKRSRIFRIGSDTEFEVTLDPVPRKLRKTPLYSVVSKLERDSYTLDLDKQLRKNREKHSNVLDSDVVRQVQNSQEVAFRSRNEIAEENILTNLKKQKYG